MNVTYYTYESGSTLAVFHHDERKRRTNVLDDGAGRTR